MKTKNYSNSNQRPRAGQRPYGQQLREQTRKTFKKNAFAWFLALLPMMASDTVKCILQNVPQNLLWINVNHSFAAIMAIFALATLAWCVWQHPEQMKKKYEEWLSKLGVSLIATSLELCTAEIAQYNLLFEEIIYVTSNIIFATIIAIGYICFNAESKEEKHEACRELLAFIVGVVVLDYMCGRFSALHSIETQYQVLTSIITLLVKFAAMLGLLVLVIFLGKVLIEVGLQIRIRKNLLKKAKKEHWKVKLDIVLRGSHSEFAIKWSIKRSKQHKKKKKHNKKHH